MKSSLLALLTAAALSFGAVNTVYAQDAAPTTTPPVECATGTAEGASAPESLTENDDSVDEDGASTSDNANCCVIPEGATTATVGEDCPPEETTSSDNGAGAAPGTGSGESDDTDPSPDTGSTTTK